MTLLAPGTSSRPRFGPRAGAVAASALILFVCLVPTGGDPPSAPPLCILCGSRGLADFLLNVILFVPLGACLRTSGRSMRGVVISAFALSMGIEVAQLWIPGRHPALGDLLANTGGGLVGAFVTSGWRGLVMPSARARRTLRALAGIAAIASVALPAVLFAPAIPGGDLRGNWNPTASPGAAALAVLEASVGGAPLPSRRAAEPSDLRRRLGEGATIRLRFSLEGPVRSRTTVFRILNESATEFLSLSATGDDLLLGLRTRALWIRLAGPAHRLDDALTAVEIGDELELSIASKTGGGRVVVLRGEPEFPAREWVVGRRAADGWMLLTGSAPGSELARTLLGILWLAGAGLLFGWWNRTLTGALALGAALSLLLWWMPSVTPLLEPSTHHFVTVLVAPWSGWMLSRGLARRETGAPEAPAA